MRVLDFNDGELLQDAVVEAQLLLFESRDHAVTNVNSEQVEQLGVSNNFAIVALNLVRHAAHIVGVLEQSGDALIAGLH